MPLTSGVENEVPVTCTTPARGEAGHPALPVAPAGADAGTQTPGATTSTLP
jgi:hypothetical protein